MEPGKETQPVRKTKAGMPTNDSSSTAKKSKTDVDKEVADLNPVQSSSNSSGQNEKRRQKSNDLSTTSHPKKLKTNPQHQEVANTSESSSSESEATQDIIPPLSSEVGEQPFPGVIKSLHLHNFMCHADFTHNFHPNLNFIIGQNGSGKSAVLSGILVGLGGNASTTSRTTNLKSLIQKGKRTCRIRVTLLNRNGLERFGEEITIERWFSLSGNGGYKIQSKGGPNAFHSRQLKKAELNNILLSLNIQIDNPAAILNQDVARSFLRTTDPKAKYKLFHSGTLLKKLEETIQEGQTSLNETKSFLEKHRTKLHRMSRDIKVLKKKCGKIGELEQIKKELIKLNHEYLWSLVIHQEKLVSEATLKTRTAKNELAVINKTLENAEEAYKDLDDQSILEEFARLQETVNEKEKELNGSKCQIKEVKKQITQLQAKLKRAIGLVASKQAMLDKVSSEIARLTAQQQARSEEEANRDKEKGRMLEEQKKQLESVAGSIKADGDNFQLAAGLEREKIQKLDTKKRNLQSEIESRNRFIKSLSTTNANKYAAFGPLMTTLMSNIQENLHRFKTPPTGPMGSTFTVKDPKFAPIVEHILSRCLTSFVVDNTSDFHLLKEMIENIYDEPSASQRFSGSFDQRFVTKPAITMMQFADELYDISRSTPSHPGAYTIFELLEVENNNHVVLNALIDTFQIEKILIFKTNAEASQILKREETVPKSLFKAYTLEWFKISPALRFSANVMRVMDQAKILKSGKDRQNEVAELKEEIKNFELELKNLEPQRAELEDKEKSMRQAYTEKMSKLSATRRDLNQVVNEIKKHANLIAQKSKACDLTSYQEELDELKEEQQSQLSIRDSVTKELEPLTSKLTELENKRMEAQGEYDKLSTEMGTFQDKQDHLKTKEWKAENLIQSLKAKKVALEAAESKCINDEGGKEKELQDKLTNAMAARLERLDTVKAPDTLERECENLKIRIRETEVQLGDVAQLQKELQNKKQQYKKLHTEYEPVSKLYSTTMKVSNSQKACLERMKDRMGRTLQLFFAAMAKQRGYEGRLVVDESTKELHYIICPDGGSTAKTLKAIGDLQDKCQNQGAGAASKAIQARKSKKLRKALVEYSLGLSGGERSFATICFIMALWQVMECPFYMLDEFDVFMDEFNRKTCQLALIAHAKKFKNFQYILFTPLDLSETPAPEDACVLRLSPPQRDRQDLPNTPVLDESGEDEDEHSSGLHDV